MGLCHFVQKRTKGHVPCESYNQDSIWSIFQKTWNHDIFLTTNLNQNFSIVNCSSSLRPRWQLVREDSCEYFINFPTCLSTVNDTSSIASKEERTCKERLKTCGTYNFFFSLLTNKERRKKWDYFFISHFCPCQ